MLDLEYNTGRNKLIISEYGRNIQKMIEHATDQEEVDKRNNIANELITLMGQLNPHLRILQITSTKYMTTCSL
jgi:hypothetical protein